MNKVLQFDKNQDRYINIAEKRLLSGDLTGALSALLSAEALGQSYKVYAKIAEVYSQMELLDLSNKYWYKFMFTAPDDKRTISYEELAINYFYLDNLWASGYYMHKKLSIDGYITRDDIDKEVMDFFTGEEIKKHAYRIVYPFEKADYEFEVKSGKRALRAGGFKEAIVTLEKVPKPCHDKESLSDLTLAYLMTDEFENAEKLCRESIERFGDTVGAYCNLSTLYDLKDDFDKADYYYKKALDLRTGEQDEPYKIATCAIERGDHKTTKVCLEKILEDRPYETAMRFFYALSLINLGEYKGAEEQLIKAYNLSRNDYVIEYYLDLARKLINKECTEKILPIKYLKELPKSQVQKWSKAIKELIKKPEQISSQLKNKEVYKMVLWGLEFGSKQVVKASAMLLSSKSTKNFSKIALEILLNPNAELETKRLLLYALILKGYKGKIGLVVSSYYADFYQKQMSCEKAKDGGIYFSSYALCISRMAFYGVENLAKIAQTADQVYKSLKTKISEAEVNNEELAGLILLQCNFEGCNKIEEVCKLFEVGQKKLELLKNLID